MEHQPKTGPRLGRGFGAWPLAQSAGANQAGLDALRARVEALENTGPSSPLKFSLENGTTIRLYGYVKGDLVSDSDFDLGSISFGLATITPPAAYGRTEIGRATGTNTRMLETFHLTARFKATDKVTFGLEYFTGAHTQGNGVEFDASRVQFSGQFSF